jgi:malic enzyme
MDTIIGLGSAGCNIARLFKNYPQYDVYMIDVDLEGEKCFALNEENNPEDYERNCPDLSVFLRHIDGDVLFVTSGGIIKDFIIY